MRKKFQEDLGDGGSGFAVAGHPYKGYRRFDLSGTSSYGWITQGTAGKQGDERNGLAGLSITADRPSEAVTVTTSGDQLALLFMRQPGGGSFSISCDGTAIGTASTEGPLDAETYAIRTIPGEHTYAVTTTSFSPVRLFGWVSDKSQGITWETLGINGAQIRMMLGWDQEIWRKQIQARDPALVVIAYGTNEALFPMFNSGSYRADLLAVVTMIKQAVPDAALLLVGPPGCDRHRPFPYLQEVIDVQRQVAQETNCAFWNWALHMDESGGRALWVQAGLSQPDFTHLTGNGYRILGQTLAQELLLQYQSFTQAANLATSSRRAQF